MAALFDIVVRNGTLVDIHPHYGQTVWDRSKLA